LKLQSKNKQQYECFISFLSRSDKTTQKSKNIYITARASAKNFQVGGNGIKDQKIALLNLYLLHLFYFYLFTFICAAITQKKKHDFIIMNSYEAQKKNKWEY